MKLTYYELLEIKTSLECTQQLIPEINLKSLIKKIKKATTKAEEKSKLDIKL